MKKNLANIHWYIRLTAENRELVGKVFDDALCSDSKYYQKNYYSKQLSISTPLYLINRPLGNLEATVTKKESSYACFSGRGKRIKNHMDAGYVEITTQEFMDFFYPNVHNIINHLILQ